MEPCPGYPDASSLSHGTSTSYAILCHAMPCYAITNLRLHLAIPGGALFAEVLGAAAVGGFAAGELHPSHGGGAPWRVAGGAMDSIGSYHGR